MLDRPYAMPAAKIAQPVTKLPVPQSSTPSRMALNAVRMIEEIESSQDGYQEWTPLYRARIAEVIDMANDVYGARP